MNRYFFCFLNLLEPSLEKYTTLARSWKERLNILIYFSQEIYPLAKLRYQSVRVLLSLYFLPNFQSCVKLIKSGEASTLFWLTVSFELLTVDTIVVFGALWHPNHLHFALFIFSRNSSPAFSLCFCRRQWGELLVPSVQLSTMLAHKRLLRTRLLRLHYAVYALLSMYY